jgi:NitT/TauT family transport system permease protein
MNRDLLFPASAILVLIFGWHFAVAYLGVPAYLLPSPSSVAQRLWQDFGYLMGHSGATVMATVGGFLLSVIVGIPLGMVLVASRVLYRAVMPLLVVSQSFPKVAIAPLIVIWFGLGFMPKILIAFSVAFFPVVVGTIAGMKALDSDMYDLARTMQAKNMKIFLRIRLPFAMPQIMSGVKVAVAFSTVGAVVAEWVGADKGLGYLLLQSNANMDTSLLFAVLFCLMAIGLVLYYAVEFCERRLIPWHVSVRADDLHLV